MSTIYCTTAAADRVAALIDGEGNPNLHLRVYVTGGGCSGFSYGFTFDEDIAEDDTIIVQKTSSEDRDIKLAIDPMSYPYLNEATIDYTKDIHGEQFVIKNPNAKTTCGCGSSFSVGDE